MNNAGWFHTEQDAVVCDLCPHRCKLSKEQAGICNVRESTGTEIIDHSYGKISSVAYDPVEKKPLFHYFPGNEILSVGSFGCNFKCVFCQNHTISQVEKKQIKAQENTSAKVIISNALKRKPGAGIAFTYNEPTVNFPFMLDLFRLAKSHNINTAVVSNGYINPEPLNELLQYTDAFNIDLKSFDKKSHKKFTGGDLAHVLNTISTVSKHNKHLEITHLVVPGFNDNEKQFTQMTEWISDNTGISTPLHISRYFPNYKYNKPATSEKILDKMMLIARDKLLFVYPGNRFADTSTYCPKCGEQVISRSGYKAQVWSLENGRCTKCGQELPIIQNLN